MTRLAGGLAVVGVAAVSLGWFLMVQPREGDAGQRSPTGHNRAHDDKAEREAFASDREGSFDADRAMDHLREICKIGPRISGSEGMRKQQELLQKHFEAHGGKVEFQRFTAQQKSRRDPVEMANLIARWHPDRQRRVIVCAHYDTRPIADQEPDERKWREPFLGANDGGSGVALLMELARHMKGLKTEVGVDFVLFDGEEYVFDPREGGDKYFFGSEHFAQDYRKSRPKHRYLAAVLLDMVAGKDARFPVEPNSWFHAAALVQELWATATALGCTSFENKFGREVLDDHLPLNRAGIRAVDIIDFEYPHWHKLSDTPENCSAATMGQVARVVIAWLQKVR